MNLLINEKARPVLSSSFDANCAITMFEQSITVKIIEI